MLSSSLRRLDIFRTIVDCGGVNAAANHLGIAQPSVTAHLRALETQLGSTLFLRSRGRRNVITPSGEALYKYACEVLSKSVELQKAVRGLDADAEETLSIAVQRAIGSYLLPQMLATFLRGRRTARVSVYGETQEAALNLLRTGAADAALVFDTSQAADMDGLTIGAEPLLIAAAPSHPLAARKSAKLQELENFDFIGGLRESQFFNLIEKTLRAAGLRRYRVALHMQDSVAIKNAAIHGLGLACSPACVLEEEVKAGQLIAIRTVPQLPPLAIKLIVNPKARSQKLLEEFVPCITAAFASRRS
ncbi:MAG: LysR family transcriptional regulator [Beijerinckiaceae bacterium]|nr:LysR family transcriptional regulator [Beijerinckiaceae bacterium]